MSGPAATSSLSALAALDAEKLNHAWRRACANFWLIVFFFICRRTPWLIRVIKAPSLWFTWKFSRTIHSRTMNNARWLLGANSTISEREALGKSVLANCFDSVAEFGINRRCSKADILARMESIEGQNHYQAARARKCGAILITAHLGSFETSIAMLTEQEKKIHVVFQRDRFPVFERLRSAQHARLGIIEAPVSEGIFTWISLRDALMRDEVVLIQGDRVMPGQRGVRVPFLGGHIEIPAGPVKLAEATGSPIIPVFALAGSGNRVRIQFHEPIWPTELESSRSQVHPALLKISAAIEQVVQSHPEQWLCLHSAWHEDSARDLDINDR